MIDRVCSREISQPKARRVLVGILATVLAGLAPCAGAAPAARLRPLVAKAPLENQVRLRYSQTAGTGISGQALGQEVVTSAEYNSSVVCVDRHNTSVLWINLDAAVPSMVSAAAPELAGRSVAGVVQRENETATAGMFTNTLAAVNAIGIVAVNLSR